MLGWLRSTDPNQKCQALLTFNPPTTVEGRWIVDFFAPWLDKKFPNPAVGGEIRYAASVDGKDVWVDDGREFVLADGVPVYEFERGAFKPEEVVKPLARTFIPSRVTDAYCLALLDTPKIDSLRAAGGNRKVMEYNPYA